MGVLNTEIQWMRDTISVEHEEHLIGLEVKRNKF